MNRDPDLEAIRLQCLDIAIRSPFPADPVAAAERMFNFVTGENTKTPRQVIDAALEASGVR